MAGRAAPRFKNRAFGAGSPPQLTTHKTAHKNELFHAQKHTQKAHRNNTQARIKNSSKTHKERNKKQFKKPSISQDLQIDLQTSKTPANMRVFHETERSPY
jgi:hypothetical protein